MSNNKNIFALSATCKNDKVLKRASINLYRAVLKECRTLLAVAIDQEPHPESHSLEPHCNIREIKRNIPLQIPLHPMDYGNSRMIRSNLKQRLSLVPSSDEYETMTDRILSYLRDAVSRENKNFSASNSESDNSLFVSYSDVRVAARKLFRTPNDIDFVPRREILQRQRLAIDSIRILNYQKAMWNCTSVSIDPMKGVRVVSTSRFIGNSSSSRRISSTGEVIEFYQFTYRIRVENINNIVQSSKLGNHRSSSLQLLGRTWRITEEGTHEVINVRQPKHGVVGKQPVIHPGEVFEYMSLCEIGSTKGEMSGYLSMAHVSSDTEACMVGASVLALEKGNEDNLFDIRVHPFQLDVNANNHK